MQPRGYRQRLIAELRDHVKNAAPFTLTFKPCGKMTDKEIKVLEGKLRTAFHQWADTWVLPWIAEIERSWIRPRKS